MCVPTNCHFRLCKVYLDGVGFINGILLQISFQRISLSQVNNNNNAST